MGANPSGDRAALEQWMWENRFPFSQTTMVHGFEYQSDGFIFLDTDVGPATFNIGYLISGLEGEMAQELARIKMAELSRAMAKSGFDVDVRNGFGGS